MEISIVNKNSKAVAVVSADEVVIDGAQSALDFIATVRYETGVDRIAVSKESISEEFFDLRTVLAGEILQKFVNYYVKLAIIGDFSRYTSKALKDFIYESNRSGSIFFAADIEDALEKLSRS